MKSLNSSCLAQAVADEGVLKEERSVEAVQTLYFRSLFSVAPASSHFVVGPGVLGQVAQWDEIIIYRWIGKNQQMLRLSGTTSTTLYLPRSLITFSLNIGYTIYIPKPFNYWYL